MWVNIEHLLFLLLLGCFFVEISLYKEWGDVPMLWTDFEGLTAFLTHLCSFGITDLSLYADSSLYVGYRHGGEHHPRGDRGDGKDRGARGFKDAREIVRERQKEKRQKEAAQSRDEWGGRDERDNGKEARKRKESLKER